jgi:mono/diheme cytochrome c family protein
MREVLSNLATAASAALLAAACTAEPAAADNLPSGQDFSQLERGRYLTLVADCGACHTDSGGKPFAGGRPIQTPFGTVVAANITPDRETGIGNWSDAQFEAAVRLGRTEDGSRLYPAMPYPYYTRMTKADVLAIRAYLNTLPAVHHPVESNQLPFPFDIRAGMRLWDALYFTPGSYKPDPRKSAEWNRGAYLVRGPGHCGACHTPKTPLGGDRDHQHLQGYSTQGWFAPDITDSSTLGLGNWSAEDIVTYLKSGHNRFAAATGPMGEEVADSSSEMTDADLKAIATFLKTEPGGSPGTQPVSAHDPAMVAGAAIYQDLCSACHRADGTGVPYLIPDLAHSSSVASREPTSVLRVLLHGAQSVSTDREPTGPAMPAFGWQLSDAQIAAVATYVRNSWGHAAPATGADAAHKARTGAG